MSFLKKLFDSLPANTKGSFISKYLDKILREFSPSRFCRDSRGKVMHIDYACLWVS